MSTSFKKEYDVVVAGAGVAGISAALEASRAGLKVAIVEKSIFSGGLATAGLVNIYLPLCDGYGKQVSYGIVEELLHASAKYGPGNVPKNWKTSSRQKPAGRYMLIFSPASFIIALDELLLNAKVDVWYDTLVCTPVIRKNRIVGVEVENKSGRGTLTAKIVIDTTGDGDIAARSGCDFTEERNKTTIWAIENSLAEAKKALSKKDGTPLLHYFRHGGEGETIRGKRSKKDYPWHGTQGKTISQFILQTRTILRERYLSAQKKGHSQSDFYPVTLPSMPQFRTTRAIKGKKTLSANMHGRAFDDSIAVVADWRKRGYVWEIPYGTMIPKVSGLITAGRCISSIGDAWEVTRVIPPAAQTGQVAGLAATLAIQAKTTPEKLDIKKIQASLFAKKIPFHLSQIS